MPEYQHLTHDELLHIAEERDQLTDEARLALDSELGRRRFSSADIGTYRYDREEAEKADDLRHARPKYLFRGGLATRFLGKRNLRRDPSGQSEQYESTLWFAILWFPVFPIATYTVQRSVKRWLGIPWRGAEVALERHPRDWEQILLTWIRAMLLLFALIVIVPRVLDRIR